MSKIQQAKAKREQQKELKKELKAITAKHDPRPLYDKHTKENGEGFIKVPASILDYLALQEYGFNADSIVIYQIIVQSYNKKDGYAFPSQYKMAEILKKSIQTVKRQISILSDVGLIEVKRRGLGRSNYYRPLRPLGKEDLFERYPRAKQFDLDFSESVEEQRNKDKQHRDNEGEF
ncbi:transcriptional regulator [Bacillus mycoides]|uniref:helix-turn-helix domain-containing protein n=1 Tax=Bacillus mycoides TaxID=1405 RepID=UPI001C020AA9|nr:helix-turn-helix domain-containing protein [Bacillus mycoides]QWI60972.1 transcriptional regulator [Bacillus mycoides]